VAKCLGKFLNEEADNALSDQDIIATTSEYRYHGSKHSN
jgi:hypothetical protein